MIESAIRIAEEISSESYENLSSDDLREIVSLIDYTSLNDTDTTESVENWMQQSIILMKSVNCFCAAWCVYPTFIYTLKKNRGELAISIATVSGNFPSGMAYSQLKIEESILSESQGADDIDMVINKGWAKEGKWQLIEKEIGLIKGSLSKAHLKVIIESGLLDPEQILSASKAAIRGGANFIKTSTGKTERGASLEAVSIMCYAIKEHFEKTGHKVGIKPSGGISDPEEAWKYVQVVKSILGVGWINNDFFRIGASRLLKNTIDKMVE